MRNAEITVRVALQVRSSHEAVGSVRRDQPLKKLREVRGADDSLVGAPVPAGQLGVRVASAEVDGMFSVRPNSVGRGHDAILKYAGVGPLRRGALADAEGGIGNWRHVVGRGVSKIVHDGNARKEI